MKKRGSIGIIISIIIILILMVIAAFLFFLLKSDKRVTCDTVECFEENFNKCKPAIWNTPSFSEVPLSYFEILGEEDGFCKLKQVMSVPEKGELEQVCKIDNSLELEEAMLYNPDMASQCEGSLFDYLESIRGSLSD